MVSAWACAPANQAVPVITAANQAPWHFIAYSRLPAELVKAPPPDSRLLLSRYFLAFCDYPAASRRPDRIGGELNMEITTARGVSPSTSWIAARLGAELPSAPLRPAAIPIQNSICECRLGRSRNSRHDAVDSLSRPAAWRKLAIVDSRGPNGRSQANPRS
jgi:hypothetical protein